MGDATSFFFELYEGLPRCGPGDALSTRRAYRSLHPPPSRPRILDLGCGNGAQTIELARLSEGHVVALDNHQPFLDELERRASAASVEDRVTTTNQSMLEMSFDDGSFDVVWSEGALYSMGFERGVRRCAELLKPGGFLAVTEVAYLRPDPPAAVATFWEAAYPAIRDVAANLRSIEGEGFEILDHFTLPESAWWDEYYGPLEARIGMLRERHGKLDAAKSVLDEAEKEIDVYRRYAAFYGYVFFVARIRASS